MRSTSAFVLLLSVLTCRAEISVGGSDLLAEHFEEPLALLSESLNTPISVEMYGTQPGKASFERGEIDLFMMALPNGEPPENPNVVYIPYAYTVVVAVVSNKNPISEMNLPQLAGVFGETAETYYLRWGELGLGGSMANRAIEPVVLDKDTGVMLELFKFRVLGGTSLKQDVGRVSSNAAISEMLATNVSVIAITNRIPQGGAAKAVSLAATESDFAFDPVEENIAYGDYPVRLRVIFNDEFAESLRRGGFYVVPENIRERRLLEVLGRDG